MARLATEGKRDRRISPEPGRPFGEYEIVDRLGHGGMAQVWLALIKGPRGFSKRIVLKTMHPDVALDRSLSEMFVREASLAAQLCHPAIVQIHRLGEVEGNPFIEMEYVAGSTLREIGRKITRGTSISTAIALRAIADCCEGLHYAHSYCDNDGRLIGLVHRDVSPENIIVSFTGHTKVLDFGVATATAVPHATIAGNLKGKYPYMAPEVLRGEPDTPSRDIYALGTILFEFVTGVRPFSAKSDAELLYKIAHNDPPRASKLNPRCPTRLSDLIAATLSRRAKDRPSDAADLGQRLREILREVEELNLEASGRELGVEVASLFPDRTDIPGSVRQKLTSGSTPRSVPRPQVQVSEAVEIDINTVDVVVGDAAATQSSSAVPSMVSTEMADAKTAMSDANGGPPSGEGKAKAAGTMLLAPDEAPEKAAAPVGSRPTLEPPGVYPPPQEVQAPAAEEKIEAKPEPSTAERSEAKPDPEPALISSPDSSSKRFGFSRSQELPRGGMPSVWKSDTSRRTIRSESGRSGRPGLWDVDADVSSGEPMSSESGRSALWQDGGSTRLAELFSTPTRKRSTSGEEKVDIFGAYSTTRRRPSGAHAVEAPPLEAPGFNEPEGSEPGTETTPEAEFHFERGWELLRNGYREAALGEWELALSIAPSSRRYRVNVERLRTSLNGEE